MIQRDNLPESLQGFQPYPVPGGCFFVRPNPDIVIQPPPIVIRPPQPKPIQPPPIEVQPSQIPPITPPPLYVRPPQLSPINVPPICVRPRPLPPITPPPIIVRPPCPQPIQPPAITISQPELPNIIPPQIVVRPPSQANIQPPTIYIRSNMLENYQNNEPCHQQNYEMPSDEPPCPCMCSGYNWNRKKITSVKYIVFDKSVVHNYAHRSSLIFNKISVAQQLKTISNLRNVNVKF